MNLTPEEREIGRDNYYEAVGVSRRQFMKELVGASLVGGASLGALYFGYSSVDDPVRVGVIGTGDEGNVLIGAMNPKYVEVKAIADIRPYNVHRAFHGDWASNSANQARPGLMKVFGYRTEEAARSDIKVYRDYKDLINDRNIQAVIIALPLHLHAKVAIEAMQAGKHVLTEKLMAHNVAQCKVMAQVARETDLYLATGHQRHYSILYDNAVHLIRWGLLGELHHIRAQWHRGNLPGKDSWQQPIPGGEVPRQGGDRYDPIAKRVGELRKEIDSLSKKASFSKKRMDLLVKRLAQWEAWNADKDLDAKLYDYRDFELSDGSKHSAMEELCRWRLWKRTGGGLMAELGSHQLDAAGIFCSALRADGKKARPLAVHAVGGRHIFPLDREVEDHVYCTFEFPGPGYDMRFPYGYWDRVTRTPDPDKGVPPFEQDSNKRIVVTYSSINGNGFGGYGETVMGTSGTLVLEREKEVMLYARSNTSSRVRVKDDKGGPTMDTQASGDSAPVAKAAETAPVSRGYREEIEHWAWCIRNKSPENQPRCKPEVALADAIIALSSNTAISRSMKGQPGYLQFEDSWYNIDDAATPDGSDLSKERSELGA